MNTKIIQFLLPAILTLFSIVSMAQNGPNRNPFMDINYWKSQPSIENIDAKMSEGYSVSETNRGGFDPITFAIFSGNPVSTIEHLLNHGNDINRRTHDSRTYLFWAASRGDLELMKFLVENGAKTDLVDSHGYSVMQFAAASGQSNTQIYDFLVKQGADLKNETDHHGRNVLLIAAPRLKNIELVDYFVKKGLRLDATDNEGNGIFNLAAQGGNIDVLKALVEKGVAIEKNMHTNENAILFASKGGRGRSNGLEVFEYLVGLGLDADITSNSGVTPLHNLSSSTKDVSILQYFIDKGIKTNEVDEDGNTPLINAASRNQLEVVAYLTEKGSDVNYTNKNGHSALTLAIQSNSAEVVAYLISRGAKTDIIDKQGNNLAYHLFETRGLPRDFDKKVNALQQAGFDFKDLQADNSTIWHLAVTKNNLDMLKQVQSIGADINAVDKQGNTVLHYAAMKSVNAELLRFLVEKGADKKITTEFGETAYDLAKENELLTQNNINIDFLK